MKKSLYKNVFPYKYPNGKIVWIAKIRSNNRSIHLGTFPYTDAGEKQAADTVCKAKKYKTSNAMVSKLIYAISQGHILYDNIAALKRFLLETNHITVINISKPIKDIVRVVNDFYKVDIELRGRQRDLVKYRQIAQYIMVLHKHTLNSIARNFGQDHTTVIYSHKVVSDNMLVDNAFREEVLYLESLLATDAKITA